MEFVAKKRKLKITIEGQTWEMNAPSIGEQQELDDKIKAAPPSDGLKIYLEFFEKKGIAQETLKGLDLDDFLDLTKFIFAPKKNSMPNG